MGGALPDPLKVVAVLLEKANEWHYLMPLYCLLALILTQSDFPRY